MSEARFLKATSTDEVIKFAKKHEVQFVDFKFTDLCGTWQHVTTSAREAYERCIPEGIPFDGSSIRGWKAINNSDMRDPQLKLRVSKTGAKVGSGDGTSTRVSTGVYDVTFDAGVLNGSDGTTTDTIVNENCAINVTSRANLNDTFGAFAAAFRVQTTGPNSVRVAANDIDVDRLIDTGFDITASC